jgi:nicotinamidase/pyrazinamidase
MIKKILLWFFGSVILIIGILIINLFVTEKIASIVTEGRPIENYGTQNAALLVIDIQEGLTGDVSGIEGYKRAAEDLIPRINTITSRSDEKGILVIYIRSEISNPLINILNNSMAKGSLGAELDRRLNVVSDHILAKKKEDAFSISTLDSILIKNEISRLFVVGLDAAHCVNSTIGGARNRGYKITAISDAIISDPDTVKIQILKEYPGKGVEVLSTEKFLRELDNGD